MKSELWQFKHYNRDTSKAHVLLHILSLHELKILKENCSRKGCIYLAEKQTKSLLCSAGSAFPQYFVSTWVKPRAQIVIAWSDACTQMFFPACSTLGSQYEVRSSTGDLLWWCTLNGRNGSPLCANLQSHLGKMTGGKLISKSCLKLLILSFYLLLFLNLTDDLDLISVGRCLAQPQLRTNMDFVNLYKGLYFSPGTPGLLH